VNSSVRAEGPFSDLFPQSFPVFILIIVGTQIYADKRRSKRNSFCRGSHEAATKKRIL
jgi:hypothetical protein